MAQTLLIGHSDSGNFKKSGPFCHALFKSISFGSLPRVSQSAMFCSPTTQHQSSRLVPLWISPMRVAANVLYPYPYDSFRTIACTICESTMCKHLVNRYLDSLSRSSLRLLLRTAPHSSIRSMDIVLTGTSRFLETANLLSNPPPFSAQRTYAPRKSIFFSFVCRMTQIEC